MLEVVIVPLIGEEYSTPELSIPMGKQL
jgi:hypothetical protein